MTTSVVSDSNLYKSSEQYQSRGIRSATNEDEHCTTIPVGLTLFPLCRDDPSPSTTPTVRSRDVAAHTVQTNGEPKSLTEHKWTQLSFPPLIQEETEGAHLHKLGQYGKRMGVVLARIGNDGRALKTTTTTTTSGGGGDDNDLNMSWSDFGHRSSSEICDRIFSRIDVLRGPNTTKQLKQRALVDLFKVLKDEGFKSTSWSTPREVKDAGQLFNLPSPQTHTMLLDDSTRRSLVDAERYYQRVLTEAGRLTLETTRLGSKHMSQRETTLMASFGNSFLFFLCQLRCTMSATVNDLEKLMQLQNSFGPLRHSDPIVQGDKTLLVSAHQDFVTCFFLGIESLQQFRLALTLLARSSDNPGEKQIVGESIAQIDSKVSGLEVFGSSSGWSGTEEASSVIIVTVSDMEQVRSALSLLQTTDTELQALMDKLGGIVADEFFATCRSYLQKAISIGAGLLEQCGLVGDPNEDAGATTLVQFARHANETVQALLLAVQNLAKAEQPRLHDDTKNKSGDPTGEPDEQSIDESILHAHHRALSEWQDFRLAEIGDRLFELRSAFLRCQTNDISVESRRWTKGILIDINALVGCLCDHAQRRLVDYVRFYRSSTKLEYVILRVFRVLVAKGYCADKTEEGGEGEGGGDRSEMKFEDDVEGTGMGEGDGKQDVTDEIENEEQLLGLKGDEENEQNKNDGGKDDQQKQLDEEEAKTGMEMEADFDGEMFDVPEDNREEDDEDRGSDNEEELDREMGDGEDPNEEVIDEKLWNESDDEDDDNDEGQEQQQEKFEKDSKAQGETLEDEMRTKEDDEEENQTGKDPANEKDDQNADDDKASKSDGQKHEEGDDDGGGDDDEDDNDDDDNINEDMEENYEDKHTGVEVREEETGVDDTNDNEDEGSGDDFDDDMNLDGNESDDNMDDAEMSGHPEGDEDDGNDDDNDDPDGKDVADGLADEKENADDNEEENVDESAMASNNNPVSGKEDENDDKENEDDQMDEECDDQEDEQQDPVLTEETPDNEQAEDAYGTRAQSGTDAMKEDAKDNEDDDDDDDGKEDDEKDRADAEGENETDEEDGNNDSAPQEASGASTNEGGSGKVAEAPPPEDNTGKPPAASKPPNPLKNPGDATKFWHKKLNLLESTPMDDTEDNDEKNDVEGDPQDANEEQRLDSAGEFEETNDSNADQVLGESEETETKPFERRDEEAHDEAANGEEEEDETPEVEEDSGKNKKDTDDAVQKKTLDNKQTQKANKPNPSGLTGTEDDVDDDDDQMDEDNDDDDQNDAGESDDEGDPMNVDDDENEANRRENKVVADLGQLDMTEDDSDDDGTGTGANKSSRLAAIEQDEAVVGMTTDEATASRTKWAEIQRETYGLSRRLCEKLRLVMEPLLATKLKGDYRTGKRINMKRVIGYIASGFRKDKIWLRRTKPAKRNYRVLLAVDNSESMKKSGAGDMALAAMATMANGMSQLEIGELGIASFGEDMRLLHPFHLPFTSQSGADIVHNFPFDEARTRTALCVESALVALTSEGDLGAMQLVFLISDGRIERDSRSDLRRLVREMMERNILLVMIVVEGTAGHQAGSKRMESIVHMKEVTFKNGRPQVKQFIEDYPFPYYIVLEDMQALPEVLGGALRQWFEMIARLQQSGR